VPEFGEQFQDLDAVDRVEGADRFVEQQQRRVEDEGPRDRDPLTLPTRQVGGNPRRDAGVESDTAQYRCHPRPHDAAVESAPHEQSLGDRLAHRNVRIEAQQRILEHVLDGPRAAVRPAVRRGQVVDALPADLDRPGRRSDQTENRAGQCRFPGAAFTDESHLLTGIDGQVDAVQDLLAGAPGPTLHPDAGHAQQRLRHEPPPSR
jgi:hypothetical protein